MFRISIERQVLWAVFLAILVGLFLGPFSDLFDPIGQIYVMLLQMVALPYICFSLIHGLGSLDAPHGKRLFFHGWPFWLLLWGLILAFIYLFAILIPKPAMALITNEGLDPSITNDLLENLIPQNPVYDLAHNIVPAVALFGIIVGCALMHLPKKEPLLSILEQGNAIIEKIFKWLAILAPVGIFAHIAVVMGTVYFEDLYKLQFYVISFIAISLFLSFWILPSLLTSFTHLTYKEAIWAIKFVCLLPFATALPTIALPFITIYMKKLGEEKAQKDPQFHSTSQTVMPLCYAFGQIGNCLILFFIFFLSFYFRRPFLGLEKGMLSLLILPLSLGSSSATLNAVDFLTKLLHFPPAAKELFSQTMEITLNFQVLVSMASVLTFIILVLYAYYGLLEIKWSQFFKKVVGSTLGLALFLVGVKQVLHLKDNYEDLYMNLSIQEALEKPALAKVFSESPYAGPLPEIGERKDTFETILQTGILKVGYDTDNIPYCYWNHRHELAGFDIAYAYQLAKDLDCQIEFYPLNTEEMGPQLLRGEYDLGLGALLMNEERLKEMDFTHPYTEQNNILIVPQKKRSQFAHLDSVQKDKNLSIGGIGGYVPVILKHFPNAKPIIAESVAAFAQGADAYMSSEIPGFIWCLVHPGYVAIDYGDQFGKQYFAYSIPNGSLDFASFLNNWLLLKEQSGFREKMFNYWTMGESPEPKEPRWSVVRNLLHWVE